jgi:hypothetical protein
MNSFVPTCFQKLPALSDKEQAKLSPVDRMAYRSAKAHEDAWGHLPPNVSAKLRGVAQLAPNAVENHAKAQKTDPVHFAAARAALKWPLGKEMSAEDFSAAIEQVCSAAHGF